MERKRGVIDYRTSENILEFTDANELLCRGHNLYWGISQFIQPWVKELDDEELREALELRGRETTRHFKGRFVELRERIPRSSTSGLASTIKIRN
jgi:GH35 family endo-1,4-beta-xylanase